MMINTTKVIGYNDSVTDGLHISSYLVIGYNDSVIDDDKYKLSFTTS